MPAVEDRRNQIVQLVNAEGSVSFQRIKQALPHVSDMTLRTDLKALDAERRIVRIHGGARSVEFVIGTGGSFDGRSMRNVDAKAAIARKARGLVRPNSTVFLDSGSTTTALARELPDEHALVFTSSITCAVELARLEHVETIVLGGNLNRYSMSLNGGRTIESIRGLNFDQLFLGVTSYRSDSGLTCGSDAEASLKHALIEQADEVIVLMDASKVGRRSTFTFGDLSDVDAVVSDSTLPADFIQACQAHDVRVL